MCIALYLIVALAFYVAPDVQSDAGGLGAKVAQLFYGAGP